MNKAIMAGIAAVVAMATSAATITDVTARQRYPWNGKVDISYTLTEAMPASQKLKVSAKN